MIAIVDYGLSNLLSVKRAFEYMGAKVEVINDYKEGCKADKIVLPGVGAFADGMSGLRKCNFDEYIKQGNENRIPILGICLGMQMMFEESDENGLHKGLGLIEGRVEKIPLTDINGQFQCVPHIGWNKLIEVDDKKFKGTILRDLLPKNEVYFVHSFECKTKNREECLAETIYGGRKVCAVVQKENIIACQFHPEKSGEVGLNIISNFIKL
jgi:imidazole glycerol phosphate synthase, glutamine amidotransferase subunit